MANKAQIQRFLEAFGGDADAETTAWQLLQSHPDLVPAEAIERLLDQATALWLRKIGKRPRAASSKVLALQCLRECTGHLHGFAQDRKIPRLGDTHYFVITFKAWGLFHLKVQAMETQFKVINETSTPAEFTREMNLLLRELRSRNKTGERMAQAHAALGRATGALWTTPSPVFERLNLANTAVADELRNRMGLADADGDKSRALLQYAIDTSWLDGAHRPTPLEGGNRRFRLRPYRPVHGAYGATVNLSKLKENIDRPVRLDDDGVRECVSPPFTPSSAQWQILIENLRFAGPLSPAKDLADCTDAEYARHVKGDAVHRDTVAGLLALIP